MPAPDRLGTANPPSEVSTLKPGAFNTGDEVGTLCLTKCPPNTNESMIDVGLHVLISLPFKSTPFASNCVFGPVLVIPPNFFII